MKTISPQEARQAITSKENMIMIDIRETNEFIHESTPNTQNIPLSLIEKGYQLPIHRDQTLLILCQSGARSLKAAKILEAQGYQVMVIDGGLNNYKKCGGEVNCMGGSFPLMRQIQITAGILIVLGFLLSKLVHPTFIYLSLFVGCGLTFAGISGFCPMGKLLEKMPWNNRNKTT